MVTSVQSDAPISFENVTFSRGQRVILDDVSISVRPGETVAIIGPSGSGKTTLFRLALGFIKPESGKIWIAGTEISKLPERTMIGIRRQIGTVFQDGALFTSMDVCDNVGFGLAETSISDAELESRVRRTLDSMQLQDFYDRMPDELSGGQAQRVAVARAIITEPRIMLYDEPTQGLDPLRALDIAGEITRLAHEGVASLVITHQLEYARRYADRIALLDARRIQYDGSFDGLRRLADPFVRSFFDVIESEMSSEPEVH
jgi:phospholipid/cholesterol/gamma-HCH transport system ATP-binding protein